MMKAILAVGVLLLDGGVGDAMAGCQGNQIGDPNDNNNNRLRNFLRNQTACGTAVSGTDKWQEEHKANGDLWDYKQGPNHPIDPQEQVGEWSTDVGTAGDQLACYQYGDPPAGPIYCHRLYEDPAGSGQYSYCTEADIEVATAIFQSGIDCGF